MLAGETGVPLPTAQKLMGRLARPACSAGARHRRRLPPRPPGAGISLADIVEAVEGPIAMTNCIEADGHLCAIEGSCRVKPHLHAVNFAVRGALQGVSLASLSGAA